MRINPVNYNYFNVQNNKQSFAKKSYYSNPIIQADIVSFSSLGGNAAKALKKENIIKNSKVEGLIDFLENEAGDLIYLKKVNSYFGGYGYNTTSTEEFIYSPESCNVVKHIFRPDKQYSKIHSFIEMKLGDNGDINEIAFASDNIVSKFTRENGFEAPSLRVILDDKTGKIKEAYKINPDYRFFTGEKPTFVKAADSELKSNIALNEKFENINQVKTNSSEYEFRNYLEEIIKIYEK